MTARERARAIVVKDQTRERKTHGHGEVVAERLVCPGCASDCKKEFGKG